MRKTRDIQRIQRQGRRIRSSSLMVLFSPSCAGQLRVALTVSRKVGNAVVRNRVKRWIREAVRQQMDSIPRGFDVVVIAHPKSSHSGLSGISSELLCAWPKMMRGS